MVFRVEIAGSIAAGKSTLCAGLAGRGFTVIPERLEENPFLSRAYSDKAQRGFDVQMAFLLSKCSAISTYNGTSPVIVTDYALVTEHAYNDMHLESASPEGHRICREVLEMKAQQLGPPDVLIILDCPVEEQLRRIKARGRDFEQGMTADYLQALNDRIEDYLCKPHDPLTIPLRLNSAETDLTMPAINRISAQIAAAYRDTTGRALAFPRKGPGAPAPQ